MISHRTTLRVRYADTDKMQFVYNGKYLEYFEVGRAELLRSKGLPYSELEKIGYQLPLIEANVKYKLSAEYDDLIEIEASVAELYSAKVHINYVIRKKETGEVLAEGFTDHMFIKTDTKKPTRPPKVYLDALEPFYNEKKD
jgi:acyl-CoA thioester hydrolase